MDITVTFPGGKRVDADVAGHRVCTDQSAAGGGEGSAPEPFHLFLSSLATCAGIYVLGFCQARGIPTAGLSLVQRHAFDPETKRLTLVTMEVGLPADFPEKYRSAVLRAAESCKVKKTIEAPPRFEVRAVPSKPTDGDDGAHRSGAA